MNNALFFILISVGMAVIAILITVALEKRPSRNKIVVAFAFKKVKYSPKQEVICNKRTPHNENTEGDIDSVKQFYPAARLKEK